jgi:peptide/nickel transport system permease protein
MSNTAADGVGSGADAVGTKATVGGVHEHDLPQPGGAGLPPAGPELAPAPSGPSYVGRSPGRLAWIRLKRDKVAMVSFCVLVAFAVLAIIGPWFFEIITGNDINAQDSTLLDDVGAPLGVAGGITGEHWLGIQPQSGRDLLLLLVYGARTSLGIAVSAALISTTIGIVLGMVAAYFGGWVDSIISWVIDFMLAFPFFLFCLAAIPVINTMLADVNGEVTSAQRVATIIGVFAVFGWMYTARLVRGQVLSLREREFVEAGRAAGAGPGHLIFRQLLPNLWAPILVTVSLAVPQLVTAEAALSFLNIGVIEPVPDWGRMIYDSIGWLETDPFYTFFPGMLIFILVLAFNLFGDSLRDALDPKSLR